MERSFELGHEDVAEDFDGSLIAITFARRTTRRIRRRRRRSE
jgi:hypothetical protein